MKGIQKAVLLLGASVIVGMLLFPPTVAIFPNQTVFRGYQFFFEMEEFVRIEATRLLLQWAAVGVVTGVIYFVLGGREKG